MEPIKTQVKVGKYNFQIIDNTLSSREGQIYSRNYRIGGGSNHPDCANVSIIYRDNQPISAYIPYIVYDPECSENIPLDRGHGSIIMLKTLLHHIHEQIPTITEVEFEDKSSIECATEEEIIKKGSKMRKKGTHVLPIPLYYFSMAFNGETWYEKNFNAHHKDTEQHKKYKAKIHELLNSEIKTPFIEFLEIAQPPENIRDELDEYYQKSSTFGDFFQSIPKPDRCRLVREWIYRFMSYHFKDVFSNTDWVIDIPIVSRQLLGGSSKKSFIPDPFMRNLNEKRRKPKTRKYYCPPGRIIYNPRPVTDLGLHESDI
jgi:hypothetical protein